MASTAQETTGFSKRSICVSQHTSAFPKYSSVVACTAA
ncbi:hypothetical protein L917_17920 [Phytophthora nicotianae]|uniref:Uncharacterized protein n=1 Tax=Phytophthora nicotianae TaxID=4792 RepID=W2K9K9_PHYNI|nr:hypothetical protein L915_18200 [Phytophthora nicotianae]ETL28575.1 hypothetical protein L916_18105 [Phytophthora nicotianae]ETL81833.1 hypothetical protein L917_17920 [Phytophthora nicotianae]